MPRHGTGLGAGNFPAANKLLMRYENDRAYKMHMQKIANVKHRLDVAEPKKHNHLVLRLKQIQKEEERQAEIDHENKLLLNKMTHVLKYGGNIDNWNNYESRSLNFPFRERQNEEIARQNLGIARRLETVRPRLQIPEWEREYQQHQYLKRLWNDSVKDFGQFTPRRQSRMSRAVKRSVDNLNDTYEEDVMSVDTGDDRKLPKLDKGKRGHRPTKSESNATISNRKDQSKAYGKTGGGNKLPKIIPGKAEDGISGQAKEDDKSDVAQLFKIAKQLSRPEDIFIKTLIKKTHKQRMTTKAKFRQKYDLDLISELKTGLGQQWEYLIDSLLQERCVADAYAVFDALSTSDLGDVVELLATRDNASIAELKESYRKEFSIRLEEDIAERTQQPTQTLLLTLQKGTRDEATEPDENDVKKDAQALVNAGEDRWETESGTFMKLMAQRSFPHLQLVFIEYKSVSGGQDILNAMKQESSRDYFKLLSVLVHAVGSPANFYAERLHKHKLPSDPLLVSILVSRSEVDMPAVRKAYKQKYGIDITEEIKSKPHPAQKCLVELASKVPTNAKKVGDAKKTYVKDGAASQQHQPQQPPAAKKPPQAKKPETKVKGQGDSSEVAGSVTSDQTAVKTNTEQQKPSQSKPKQDNAAADKSKTTGNKQGENSVSNRGTVKPFPNFNADEDCEKLSSAMAEGNSEKTILAIIPKRSNKQRQQLKATYEQKYKKNLMIDLEEQLAGDNDEMVLALMTPPCEYDAYVLHEAVEGLGASEATLIGIVCTRSPKEMKEIREHYQKAYKSDLEKDITRDCSAGFQALLIALVRTGRQPGTSVNADKAKQDAKMIYESGLPGEVFEELIIQQSHVQVKATFEEYKKLAGEDIYASLAKANLGDDEEGYISVAKAVEDPVKFYTEKIHGSFTNMGTNDNMLIRLCVSRSEIDLMDIKTCYQQQYSRGLYEAVNSQVRGDYKPMLLAVIDNQDTEKSPKKAAAKKKSSEEKGLGGTVKPAQPFNPVVDSERLFDALDGVGADEAVIIEILPHRSNGQRQEIKAKYQDKFSQNLQVDLQAALYGDFEEIVLGMMMKPVEYDAHCLHEAVSGLGTDEAVLIAILSNRTGKELAAIKAKYKEVYGRDLQTDITQDISRGFEDMAIEILKCEREQGDAVDVQLAKSDAYRLYKEGQISIDPQEAVFREIIARKSRAQVQATFKEYQKQTGNDVYYGIEKALIGDDEEAYIGLAKAINDPVLFYTEALHGCFQGLGTNDKRLIRIIVSRSEIDLADIKARYVKKYKTSLSQKVQDECSGDCKNILLAIIDD